MLALTGIHRLSALSHRAGFQLHSRLPWLKQIKIGRASLETTSITNELIPAVLSPPLHIALASDDTKRHLRQEALTMPARKQHGTLHVGLRTLGELWALSKVPKEHRRVLMHYRMWCDERKDGQTVQSRIKH